MMKVGDIVTFQPLIDADVPLIIGVIIETDLHTLDDTRREYEDKAVVRVKWPDGISEQFEEHLVVINESR
tara:strand:+ start:514 stop:723 length:210 start_codon:yes stop_codon:yes gene_type:complete